MSSKTAARVALEDEKKSRTASPAKETKKKSKVAEEAKVPEVVQEKSASSNKEQKEQNEKSKASVKTDKKQKTEEVKEKEPKEAVKPTEKQETSTKSDKKNKAAVESKLAPTKETDKATENKEKAGSPVTKERGKNESETKDKATVPEVPKDDAPESKGEEKPSTSETKEPKTIPPEPKSNVPEHRSIVSEPKSNGSDVKQNGSGSKVNGSGSKVNGSEPANGHNGDTMETIDLDNDDDCVMSGPDQDNDEHFPELSYDDTSDNDGFEPSTPDFLGVNRSTTRRSQAKSNATPETPACLSRVTTAEPRSDSASTLSSAEDEAPKMQKGKEEVSAMRLRSSDIFTITEKSDEIPSQSELNAANLLKTDTNFSKSRIKISPYRRGARPLDSASMIVNYTGSTTTLDDSFNTSGLSDKTSDILDSDASQVSSLKSIKGRRSYKELREVTLRSATLQRIKDKAKEASKARMDSLTAATAAESSSVPVAQVVGRKRRTSNTQLESSQGRDEPEIAAKRARLLQRVVVSPFSSLVTRGRSVLASSTPLTVRRNAPQVTVDSYADPSNEIALDDIKPNSETDITVDSDQDMQQIEMGQSAMAGEGERKRCSIM